MKHIELLSEDIERQRDKIIRISEQIWQFAETRFEEYQSAELLCRSLEEEGFVVERGVGGIETAFIGSYGSGKPIIAFLGEYDALSGLSQLKGIARQEPVEKGGNGHGCGHHLLGSASLAAALALKNMIEQNGLSGTVRYYGCPGEEGGSGKAFMARAGLFDDVDFSLCWHPMDYNSIMSVSTLANVQVYFRFKGKSAHAAAAPHLGRSALDAVELMNIGANYLREHIEQDARLHYAITNSGGFSPNVVQANAEVLYLIRAPQASQVQHIYNRVCDIARGAALMTGTEVEIVFDKACSNLMPSPVLEQTMYRVFEQLGVPEFTAEELAYAAEIRTTLDEQERAGIVVKYPGLRDKDMADILQPYTGTEPLYGSTDVGDVSWITPTVQCTTACFPVGTQAHTWQWVASGATSIGHKGMLHAAKVMAATAAELLEQPELVAQAQADLRARLGDQPYVCPIPPEIQPGANKVRVQ
ncbi:M20 family metallopeptidase [Paenibacillus kribbensis]|uniref:M20 family metallopeptidase n=1 Tax=Paenibacillus kribbensis TaxID=172713 RepID=UPI0015BCE7C7|nr:M20 family metallopeptidase [Paenibacillus kribbensis]